MAIERVTLPAETRAPTGSTNAYVVGDGDGLLVDPAARSDRLSRLVEDRGISHLAVTHTHPDHVGGVAHYASSYDCTVWSRAGREDRFERAVGIAPDRSFREGDRVGPARVIDTPGHAPDHVAFAVDDAVLVGDLAVAEGSVVVGSPGGDMRAYLTSLRRLLAMGFRVGYPGHGPTIEDPCTTFQRLISHRLARERRIRQAVAGGAMTLSAIVDGAYDVDLSGVRDLAEATVAAHLEKLAIEGDVAWDGERIHPV